MKLRRSQKTQNPFAAASAKTEAQAAKTSDPAKSGELENSAGRGKAEEKRPRGPESALSLPGKGGMKKDRRAGGAESQAAQIQALEALLKERNRESLYLKAEFENYKRRALKEKSDLIRYGGEGFIRALADEALDDFERAFEGLEKNADLKSFERGIRLIYKNIQKILIRFHIKAHDPSGEAFDPRFHEALSRQPSAKTPENSVISTFKKGYTLDGKLIRPAQVIVAAKKEGKKEPVEPAP